MAYDKYTTFLFVVICANWMQNHTEAASVLCILPYIVGKKQYMKRVVFPNSSHSFIIN